MQTQFSAAQLADADTAESERSLRKCVHCGFCTATCPTYVLLGDELDSPRGRIYLIKDMLEHARPATAGLVRHVDRCLSCLACVTTCPSGVDYRHLIEHARAHIERSYRRPWRERVLRAWIAAVLPHPGRLRAALRLGMIVRPLSGLLPPALRTMLALAPRELPRAFPAGRRVFHAAGMPRARVALLTGCAQRALTPGVHEASLRLLNRLGAEVVTIEGCCGALTHHMGRERQARTSAAAVLARLVAERGGAGLDAVVTSASGCGLHVKDYAHVFRADARRSDDARDIAQRSRDITEVLAQLGLPAPSDPPGWRIAYHSACTLQHGQGLDALPRELLRKAGYVVEEIEEGHLCCGSAGTYNLLQPHIAARLRERKLANIRRTGAQLVATGNIGCAMQLASGELPVWHTVELLERALTGATGRADPHGA
jgi:glycolate oxidase iron-sulfur subunit